MSSTQIVTPQLTIEFSDLELILTPVGYPVLTEEDFPINFEDIVRLCAFPSFSQFMRYNPFTLKTYHTVALSFDIPFPNVDTYGVVDSRISMYQNASNALTGNFYNDVRFLSPMGQFAGGRNGFPIGRDTLLMQEVDARTWVNIRKAGKLEVDEENRLVHGSSSSGGELEITWAVAKHDFSAIPFSKKDDVIRLAQANLLRFIGMLDSQQENNTGVTFDSQLFLSRADELETAVLTRWRSRTKAILLRG